MGQNVIEKLQNNEQILLMYLADELPPQDRTEVEQLLLTDGWMRNELEQLRAVQGMFDTHLAQLDKISPLPISSEFAAKQIGRAMRQEMARPKPTYITPPADRPVRSWRWLYPTVAAASIAIVAMIWLTREARPTGGTAPVVVNSPLPHFNPPNDKPVVANQDSRDPDDTLLIQSLESRPSGDEEVKQIAEAGPQDELSQYLLSVASQSH